MMMVCLKCYAGAEPVSVTGPVGYVLWCTASVGT
jgi:hypothetical protein